MTGNCNVAFETLVDYVEDSLDHEERARLESHFASGCPHCQRSLTWLRRTIQLIKTDDSVAPPAEVIECAKKLFKEGATKPRLGTRTVAAQPLFDSGLQVSPAGTQSGGMSVG